MELFVPGRVCLLGEHTDWAGGFRRFNKELCKGFTVVTGTNQGLYARVSKHPSKLIVTSTDNDGNKQRGEFSMDAATLLRVAREGGHFSYVCGVAYKVMEDHVVGGVEIDNYMTTLPLKKGLSSSAAACVLAARALNHLYDLRLTVRGEMEMAYAGETLTPSQCGRLDQACAFGSTPVLMSYDGDFVGVDKINVGLELHFVIVDLCAEKSTTEILQALQGAYPFATSELHSNLQRCLGATNQALCERMMELLSASPRDEAERAEQVARIGALLSEAQAAFDEHAGAVCPSQLTAPVLHKCLSWPSLQPLITGGKGVGAGGDGTAQLLCKDHRAADEVCRIVKDELGMDPLLLTISPGSKVRTALIPAGGFAGELFPASQASKAELFPVLDPSDGLLKPLVLGTVEQLLQAGLERVVIIVQADDLAQFKRLLNEYVTPSNARRLPSGKHESYSRRVIDVGRHVSFVVQEKQMGFGHAVYCAREVVGDNPFLLVLGHHRYLGSDSCDRSCAEQVLDAYHALGGANVLGLKHTPADSVSSFGCAAGVVRPHAGLDKHTVLGVTSVVERPDRDFAEKNLKVEGLEDGSHEYLTMFGMYALNKGIFDLLAHDVKHDIRDSKGEIAFTPALDRLRHSAEGLTGIVVDGERLPINTPDNFIRTNARLLELWEKNKAAGRATSRPPSS